MRQNGEKIELSGIPSSSIRAAFGIPIECCASPIRDSQGLFAGMVIVFRDVGSRRAAERALQSSEESRAENADALFEEKERAQVTLNSIGDAVVSTNFWGRVTYLNIVAERMTGWTQAQASGRAVDDVFRLIDVMTRNPIATPTARAIIENRTVGLAEDCMLIRCDGVELAIETSAAPIHDRQGGVIGAVMVAHDVTIARELSHKLARLALHDSLTDVPNRTLLSDRLDQAMMRAHRAGSSVAVLYIDLDRFKHINDSLGHAVGDQLLKSVAHRLLTCVRSSDTVSRQGGDEFLVLLADVVQPHDAALCAEKIVPALDAPHRIAGHDLRITASIGIATYPGDAAGCGEPSAQCRFRHVSGEVHRSQQLSVLQARDERQCDRAPVRRDGPAPGGRAAGIRAELSAQGDLETGAVVGVEALIRWHRPRHGVMLPARFIPIAEESG